MESLLLTLKVMPSSGYDVFSGRNVKLIQGTSLVSAECRCPLPYKQTICIMT